MKIRIFARSMSRRSFGCEPLRRCRIMDRPWTPWSSSIPRKTVVSTVWMTRQHIAAEVTWECLLSEKNGQSQHPWHFSCTSYAIWSWKTKTVRVEKLVGHPTTGVMKLIRCRYICSWEKRIRSREIREYGHFVWGSLCIATRMWE